MLNICTTNSYNTASKYIIGLLSAIDKRNLDYRHIVIVPDRASMSYEQLILDNVGGSFNIEVLTFRRLANRLIEQQGYLTKQASIMVLTGIIADNKDKLCCYNKGTDNIGFVQNLYEVICQFKFSRINADSINADMLPPALQDKMRDIKLLYAQYEQYLSLGYVDSATKLDKLIDTIECMDISNYHFYVTDFESLSKQELAIVMQLAKKSANITVTCCYSNKAEDKYLYLNDIFNQLRKSAKQSNIECNITHKDNYANALTHSIGQNLYRYGTQQQDISRELLSIYILPSINQEVIALANNICAHVRNGGKYGDYYVVSSQPEKYRHAIERVFADNNIPFFMDTQSVLYEHPLCQYVIDYLLASRNNYKQDNVLTFVKNYFFEGGSDIYHFENYCLKYNISYDYSVFELGKNDKNVDYDKAQAVRQKLFAIIDSTPIPPKGNVDDYVAIIRSFMRAQELERKICQFADFCQYNGQSAYANASRQAYDKLNAVLTQYEQILGNKSVKIDEFIKTLSMGLSSTTISVLPIVKDSVVITNMGKSRKHDIDVLALLGANNCQMPIVKKDNKLLSDSNMLLLNQHGLELDYLTKLENNRERFNVFQLLHEPNRLFITCGDQRTEGAMGNAIKPADFVQQLIKIFGRGHTPYAISHTVDEDTVYTVKSALSSVIINQRKLTDNIKITNGNYQLLQSLYGQTCNQFYFDNDSTANIECGAQLFTTNSPTSVSKVETFYSCPLMHYYNCGLHIKPRTVAKLDNKDFGIILHAVLEKYVRLMDRLESDDRTAQLIVKCFNSVMQEEIYVGIVRDVSQRLTLKQLCNECIHIGKQIKQQLKHSQFTNYSTELTFGMEQSKIGALTLGNQSLKGTIDRVDRLNDMFFCMDYKSGSMGESYSENMLYVGKKMQLPLYCLAIVNNLMLQPVGFYYLKLSNDYNKDGDRSIYKGRSIDNLDTLLLLDDRLRNDKSELLSVKLKKDGTLPQSNSVITKEQLYAQMKYAGIMVERAGKLLQVGFIKPSVITDNKTCDRCDYNSICSAPSLGTCIKRAKIDSVNAQTIVDVVCRQLGVKSAGAMQSTHAVVNSEVSYE
ncbi:MAG: PD-(D/E)XK nuclease family protein [Clostridia bacterium]|nr:PD-(D/E)XK nuclease family protein [Clostridia bacterium]